MQYDKVDGTVPAVVPMKHIDWLVRLFHPGGGMFVVPRLSVTKQIVVSTSLTAQFRDTLWKLVRAY